MNMKEGLKRLAMDSFEESQHPRDKEGEFSSGGGGGSGPTPVTLGIGKMGGLKGTPLKAEVHQNEHGQWCVGCEGEKPWSYHATEAEANAAAARINKGYEQLA